MPAGGQPGNKNGARTNRLWGDTLHRALIAQDGKALRTIAEKLIERAKDGDIQAIKEIGDRLDGKAMQAVEAKVEGNISLNVSQGDASVL